jgi:selenocysteine-specific elongation factor
MATVVIGTAGHIDHGKTTLLRALTGIDADRLPEEQARGMTIDVGFAHLDLDDRTSIDFVDVPGHDRLVGNMLVGAGEIDAVLLVIAADDGPRAQTFEHLELLDGLGLTRAVVAITKTDVVDEARVAEVVGLARSVVDRTSMAGARVVAASATTGLGVEALRSALVDLRDAVLAEGTSRPAGPLRLAVDRAFGIRGRGAVVTGTLRGGSIKAGDELRIEPASAASAGTGVAARRRLTTRVREVQIHHGPADHADGGRVALNLAGIELSELRRGQVLAAGPGIVASDRLLVALSAPASVALSRGGAPAPWPPSPSTAVRLHLWTETVDASVRSTGGGWLDVGEGRRAAILRLSSPIGVLSGARAVLRDPGSSRAMGGVVILDPSPPRGVSRRRMTGPRLSALARAIDAASGGRDPDVRGVVAALLDLHGAIDAGRLDAAAAAFVRREGSATSIAGRAQARPLVLAPDVLSALEADSTALAAPGPTLAELRATLGLRLRRLATIDRASAPLAVAAVAAVIEELVADGRLDRDGDRIRVAEPGERADAAADARAAALARLQAALDADVPPSLAEAARASGCGPDGIVALERGGRIVRVEDDLAWSASRYASLRDRALAMATQGPLAPAAFRDAIGGNRRVALALLEDFGRRGLLRRTDAGHVPGPKAPR